MISLVIKQTNIRLALNDCRDHGLASAVITDSFEQVDKLTVVGKIVETSTTVALAANWLGETPLSAPFPTGVLLFYSFVKP